MRSGASDPKCGKCVSESLPTRNTGKRQEGMLLRVQKVTSVSLSYKYLPSALHRPHVESGLGRKQDTGF